MTERIILGLTEKVTIFGTNKGKKVMARVDTGATKSSIDSSLVKELDLGPIVKTTTVKSAEGGSKQRPVLKAKLKIDGMMLNPEFTVADRKHMKYRVLIGQNILNMRPFLIDPHKREQ